MYILSWVAMIIQICFVTLAIGKFCGFAGASWRICRTSGKRPKFSMQETGTTVWYKKTGPSYSHQTHKKRFILKDDGTDDRTAGEVIRPTCSCPVPVL